MNIFLLLTITMALIIFLLRRHIPIGPCMLAGGLLIWVVKTPELSYLVRAFMETLSLSRTYDIILALYFVMCLEIQLRTSGALEGMVKALQRIFSSATFTLAADVFSRPQIFCQHHLSGCAGEYHDWRKQKTPPEVCSPRMPL